MLFRSFAFDPRLITNSFLGLTEPLFVLLGITSFFLFLGNNRSVYASFGVLALMALVRYEGLLLLVPFSIMYFVRFRKDQKFVIRYLLAALLFALVLLPMAYVRIQTTGQDGLVSHFLGGSTYVSEFVINGTPDDDYPITVADGQEKITSFMIRGITTMITYVGWLTIPNCCC